MVGRIQSVILSLSSSYILHNNIEDNFLLSCNVFALEFSSLFKDATIIHRFVLIEFKQVIVSRDY